MPKLEKYSKDLDYSYALGLFPTFEALNKAAKFVKRVIISEDISTDAKDNLIQSCEKHSIRLEYAGKLLQSLSGKSNCFAAAVFAKSEPELSKNGNHLVLHNISDKGNLGTILRAALGFSFFDVAIINPSCDKFDPQVVRASMGAIFSMRVRDFSSFDEYESHHNVRQFYPLMLDSSTDIREEADKAKSPFSLIMGNEGSGLPKDFALKGTALRIMHSSAIDSLNLSVASSIAMFMFSKYNL